MAKNNTLENVIHWLSTNKDVTIIEIAELAGLNRDGLANLRRAGKKGKQEELLKKLEDKYSLDLSNLDKNYSIEVNRSTSEVEKLLRAQIENLIEENKHLRAMADKLVDSMLEKKE